MGSEPPVALLDLEPDLIRYLDAHQRAEARTMLFPVRLVTKSELDVRELLNSTNAFGGALLDGMMIQRLRLGGHQGVRLLGPGDLVSVTHLARSSLISESICRAVLPTRLAVLGYDLLAATHRWPMLVAGLQARNAEQAERSAVQLMICQLPRVEDRVLAMLWLLAETWGQVTTRGTLLPLTLTHELLGLLVGARRPTVSLALRVLSERGALLKQDAGWLLIERPVPAERDVRIDDPQMISRQTSDWSPGAAPPPAAGIGQLDHDAINASFEFSREEHEIRIAATRKLLEELRVSRELSRDRRVRIPAGSGDDRLHQDNGAGHLAV